MLALPRRPAQAAITGRTPRAKEVTLLVCSRLRRVLLRRACCFLFSKPQVASDYNSAELPVSGAQNVPLLDYFYTRWGSHDGARERTLLK